MHSRLNERQLQILRKLNKPTKQIADEMGMSPRTIDKALERIFVILRVTNRTDAVLAALRMEIIGLHEYDLSGH